MRRVVHERHKNQVRSNPRVTHTLWAQIDETVAKYHDIAGTRLPADPLPPYEQSKRKVTKGRKKAILKVEPDSPAVTHDGGAEALAAALNNAQLDQTGYAVSRAQKRGRVTDTFEDAEIDELAFDYDPAPEAGSSERQTPWFARERSAQERQPKRQKVTGDHAGGPLIPSLI